MPVKFDQTYEPVSPVDIVDGSRTRGVGFATEPKGDKGPSATARAVRSDSSSSDNSLKSPRKARFAEATSVNSPATGPGEYRSPFADPIANMSTENTTTQKATVSDVGFGYINNNDEPVAQEATFRSNLNGPASPLKSALKVPGTPGRHLNPLSPTFREEQVVEKQELSTDEAQARDLKVKTRVRMAKMVLRFTNFSCSLIVLSMLTATFQIFNATKHLPKRNGLPAWNQPTPLWPQILLLCIAGVSLVLAVVVFWAYWRGGHRKAEKIAVYYTMFAIGFFVFSIIMWAVGAGILHSSKANGGGKDLWGWSCKDNKRKQLFQDDVHYALVCRLQDWSLVCCIIEVVVETITIAIYGVVFYRFWSKNKLRKSMDVRDRARSDLYLAQLRSQSAPNTPGFPITPRTPGFPSMKQHDAYDAAENGLSGYHTQLQQPPQQNYAQPEQPISPQTSQPFKLQAPPVRIHNATPRPNPDGFEAAPMSQMPPIPMSPPPVDRHNDHQAAAPGEQVYDAVPIPGQYAGVPRAY